MHPDSPTRGMVSTRDAAADLGVTHAYVGRLIRSGHRVAGDHELARAFPHHFTSAAAAPVCARSTTRSTVVDTEVEEELRVRRERLAQLRAQTIARETPRSGRFLRDDEPPEGWTYENCGVELRSVGSCWLAAERSHWPRRVGGDPQQRRALSGGSPS